MDLLLLFDSQMLLPVVFVYVTIKSIKDGKVWEIFYHKGEKSPFISGAIQRDYLASSILVITPSFSPAVVTPVIRIYDEV